MKKLKVSILALAAMAGGALIASAQDDTGETWDGSIKFGTNFFGNNAPFVFDVNGMPSIALSKGEFNGFVSNDGAGKAYGVAEFTFFLDAYQTNVVDCVGTVSGSIKTTSTSTEIQLTAKGNGRSWVGNVNQGKASLNLKFKGTVIKGVTEVLVETNIYVITTNLDGSGPDLTWIGTPTTVNSNNTPTNGTTIINPPALDYPLGTNIVVGTTNILVNRTNTYEYIATGTWNGTVNTGLKASGSTKKIQYKDEPGALKQSGVYWVRQPDGTLEREGQGGLSVHSLDIRATVIRFGKSLWLGGPSPFLYYGTGSQDASKSPPVKAKLTGQGSSKGSQLQLEATTTVATNGYITVGTNPPVPVVITVPGSVTIKSGKVMGQKVPTTTGGKTEVDTDSN